MHWRTALLAMLMVPCGGALATTAGVVEGLQMPAWLERGGRSNPVSAGTRLEPGDRLLTGPSARLLLRLDEGSLVKLGENSRFEIGAFTAPRHQGGVFKGLLNVLKGAFRFTTTLVSQRYKREFDVHVATVTAGIRGTDLWGKAAPDKDIVCLIEGRIQVRRGEEAPLIIANPMSFYVAPKGQPALPVGRVAPEQLKKWAQETELTPGQGIARSDGHWALGLQSFRRRAAAEAAGAALHQAGYAAQIRQVTVAGKKWYRLTLPGFITSAEARAFARRMASEPAFRGAWTLRMSNGR